MGPKNHPVVDNKRSHHVPSEGRFERMSPQHLAALRIKPDGGVGHEVHHLTHSQKGSHHRGRISCDLMAALPAERSGLRIQRHHASAIRGSGRSPQPPGLHPGRPIVAMAHSPLGVAFLTHKGGGEILGVVDRPQRFSISRSKAGQLAPAGLGIDLTLGGHGRAARSSGPLGIGEGFVDNGFPPFGTRGGLQGPQDFLALLGFHGKDQTLSNDGRCVSGPRGDGPHHARSRWELGYHRLVGGRSTGSSGPAPLRPVACQGRHEGASHPSRGDPMGPACSDGGEHVQDAQAGVDPPSMRGWG